MSATATNLPPFTMPIPATNFYVECSYDLLHWYDGEGIVWQTHNIGTNGQWEIIRINQKENPVVFFRLKATPK